MAVEEQDDLDACEQEVSAEENLWRASCFLVKMLRTPFVGALVREGHLSDLTAGLLQVGFGPGMRDSELGKKARGLIQNVLEKEIEADLALETLLVFVTPASPEWCSAAAGMLLSQTMLRPNAVLALLTLLLDEKQSNKSEEGLFSKAAVLITAVPRSFGSRPSEFYALLCGQLLQCLRSKSNNVRFCVALCVERLLRQDPDTVAEHFLKVVVKPLMAGEASEVEVDRALSDLSLLLVPCGASGSSEAFWDFLIAHCIRRLFLLGCLVVGSISRVKGPVVGILESAVKLPLRASQQRALINAMFLDATIPETMGEKFVFGPSGGVVLVRVASGEVRDWERECSVLCSTVLKAASANLLGDLFAEAVQYVCHFSGEGRPSTRYLLMLELSSELLEVPNLLKDVCQVLLVLKSLLATDAIEESMAQLCLGLLEEMLPKLSGLKKHEESLLSDLIPMLQNVGHRIKALFLPCATLIDRIKEIAAKAKDEIAVPPPSDDGEEKNADDFEKVLKDVTDPLLPVRAHALISLRKLVLAKDKVTLANFHRVLEIFSQQMQNSDSYVYLGAIQGLAALGDVAAAQTIPLLVKDFHNPKLATETRLKVGEATVTIAQRSGEMLPVHAPLLMDCFLRGAKDAANADIRASSLANIGAMCEILNWSLYAFLREIVHAVMSILAAEKDEMVRRAAMVVFALLIRGLGQSKLRSMAPDLIEPISDRLKLIIRDDGDDLMRHHASEALQELNDTFLA